MKKPAATREERDRAKQKRLGLLWPMLVLVTAATYRPVWHGGMLWDDNAHLTSSGMQSALGLRRIWTDVGATQQYYPVVHSTFWVFHRIWGDDTLGYHLANITLHATSAFLMFVTLRQLAIPGAILAAFVFALHPVNVESVAWMTELKNTLSTVFYLAAAFVYVRYDEQRERRLYAISASFFVLALLSKTVAATLPAALLVVFWWKRGRLDWRRDVRPLVPFFVLGAAAGLMTAWFERSVLGARGIEYPLTWLERVLLAGRALCFYATKLLWPVNLTFIYPRWQIDPHAWRQYLYPLGTIVALWISWLLRTRTRSPLAGALLFAGALFPALGFVDVYPFRYSYVADHFQYLATVPAITVICAGLVGTAMRLAFKERLAERTLVLLIGVPLALLTWNQSREYADADTLYRATLARNPDCWLCHNNLATPKLHGSREELDEAIAHIRDALRANPSSAEAHNNLGAAFQKMGRLDEALREHQEAARLNPNLPDAQYNIGVTCQALGRADDAMAAYAATLRLEPDYAAAHNNLGTMLQAAGRVQEAREHFVDAVRLDPNSAQARLNLGSALERLGRIDEAIAQYRDAVRLEPHAPSPHASLGVILAAAGRSAEGITELKEAIRLGNDSPATRTTLGSVLLHAGQSGEAMAQFREAIERQTGFAPAHYQLAIALATTGRPADAIVEFEQALKYEPGVAEIHNDLGAALANVGRIDAAMRHFEEALRIRPDYADARRNLEKARSLR